MAVVNNHAVVILRVTYYKIYFIIVWFMVQVIEVLRAFE